MKPSVRSGFTLIELMVALLAGSIAVAGVFYLNGVSSRSYNEQMRVSEMQLSLRSAMEQLRRDFSRAGYLAAPNSATLSDCSGIAGGVDVSPLPVQALQVFPDGSPAAAQTLLSMTGTPPINLTRADRVVAMGNYATADAYVADPERSDDSTIVFQPTSESFIRSFFNAVPGGGTSAFDAARFTAAFSGRMVRVENEGRMFFRQVNLITASATAPSITLTTALPYCFKPSTWTAIAPVMTVQYQLESDDSSELSRLAPPAAPVGETNLPVGQNRALLVRRELNANGAAIAGTSRVLLDFAVEFAVDAITNTAGAGATPTWALVRGAGMTAASANPQNFRSLIVTLSSRSTEADPRLPHLTRASTNDPLLTFRVATSPSFTANSRVRTLRSEILLSNL